MAKVIGVTTGDCDKICKGPIRFKLKKKNGISGSIYVDKEALGKRAKKIKPEGNYKIKLKVVLVKKKE